ncbi:MAG: cytochrome c-type biogenesis protein [Pyrinomonadaceae bacterium]
MRRLAVQFILLAFVVSAAVAQEAKPFAEDPALEQRLMNLAQELRCLVCQNETLADSRADLALDLRSQIREQMKAGRSDKEIVAFLTTRYGDFILYRPPVKPTTYLLWFGPFVLMIVGLTLLFRNLKQRRELIIDKPLSQDERRRAEELLGIEPGKVVPDQVLPDKETA